MKKWINELELEASYLWGTTSEPDCFWCFMPKHIPYFRWRKYRDPNKKKEQKLASPNVLPYRKKRERFETFRDYYLRVGRNNGFKSANSFKLFLRESVPLEWYVDLYQALPSNPIWCIEHYRLQILLDREFTCEDYDRNPDFCWPLNRKICRDCYSDNDVVLYFWYEQDRELCHLCGSVLIHKLDEFYSNFR